MSLLTLFSSLDTATGSAGPTWTDIGLPPEVSAYTWDEAALGISQDGSTVWGHSTTLSQAWIWTLAGGYTLIPPYSGETESYIGDISADGTTVTAGGGGITRIWNTLSGYSSLGGANTCEYISDDGSTVGGIVDATNIGFATVAGGISAFPMPPNSGFSVSYLSGDGSTIAGTYVDPDTFAQTPFLYTIAGGFVYPGFPVGTNYCTFLNGLSYDGSVLLGTSVGSGAGVGWKWVAGTGLVETGDHQPLALSDDATVILYQNNIINQPEVWTSLSGYVTLAYLPGDIYAVTNSHSMSGDGSIIYGWSINVDYSASTFVSWDGTGVVAPITVPAGFTYDLAWPSHDGSVSLVHLYSGDDTHNFYYQAATVSTDLVVAITSTTSVSATAQRSRPLAEAIASTTSQVATIHKLGAAAETIASTSSLTSAPKRSRKLAAAIASTTVEAATIHRLGPLSEAISSTSSQTSALSRVKQGLVEAVASTTVQSATVHKLGALSEAISSTTAQAATIKRSRALAASISSSSSQSATLHKIGSLKETVSSTTAQTAAIARSRAIAASISSTSSVAMASIRTRPISEAITSTTSVSAAIGKAGVVQVPITSTTAVAGTLHKIGAVKATISSATAVTSDLRSIHPISEAIASTSATTVVAGRVKQGLVESITPTSAVVVQLFRTGSLSEAISATSQINGALTPLHDIPATTTGGPGDGKADGRKPTGLLAPLRLSERQVRKRKQAEKFAARALPVSKPDHPEAPQPTIGLAAFRGGMSLPPEIAIPPYQSSLPHELEQIRVMAETAAAEDEEEAIIALLLAA